MALLTLLYLKILVSPLFTQVSELVYLDENIVPFFFVKFSPSDIVYLYIIKNVCCASFFEWSVKWSLAGVSKCLPMGRFYLFNFISMINCAVKFCEIQNLLQKHIYEYLSKYCIVPHFIGYPTANIGPVLYSSVYYICLSYFVSAF